MHKIYAHLLSDSTGDTVSAIAKAVFTRFESIEARYYTWALIGTKKQLARIINIAKKKRGVVLHTISNSELTEFLQEECEKSSILCIDVIENVTNRVALYLCQKPTLQAGRAHALDEEYFKRIESINFTISHDDGQSPETLKEADIILIGPSRTSKSPTSMYLAHKGAKVANIPFVSGIGLDLDLKPLKNSFIVGLYTSVERLIDVRTNRLLSLNSPENTAYTSEEGVGSEVREAKRFCITNKIPVVDVTNKSIEETSAKILQLYHSWRATKDQGRKQ